MLQKASCKASFSVLNYHWRRKWWCGAILAEQCFLQLQHGQTSVLCVQFSTKSPSEVWGTCKLSRKWRQRVCCVYQQMSSLSVWISLIKTVGSCLFIQLLFTYLQCGKIDLTGWISDSWGTWGRAKLKFLAQLRLLSRCMDEGEKSKLKRSGLQQHLQIIKQLCC